MLEAGLFARALGRVAVGCSRAGLPRCGRHLATTRDVAELNQELDTFFGAAANPENNEKRQLSHSGQTLEAASYTAVSTRNNFNRPALGGISFAADSYQRPQSAHLEQHLSDTSPHDDAGVDSLSVEQQQQQRHAGPHLTHIDSSGSASMVDVSQKAVTVREAQASCVVQLGAAFEPMAANAIKKGDVVPVATLAGIQGAKATATLIPLCHNIPLSKVDVKLQLEPSTRSVTIRALARSDGKTGVEMEALTAVSVAALTVYDMCKAVAKDMVIGAVQLDYKAGGKSGLYLRSGLTLQDLLPSARPPV